MPARRTRASGPVPATRTAPPLPHHPVTFHRWRDVVLAHWRVD